MIQGIKIDYKNTYIMSSRPTKDCRHCVNGHYQSCPGSYDEPPWEDFSCDKEDLIPEEFWEAGGMDTWPETCGHFDPHMVKKCACCGQEMNVPEYLCLLRADGRDYEDAFVCSPACLVVIEAEGYEWHRQEEEDERKYIESLQEERL